MAGEDALRRQPDEARQHLDGHQERFTLEPGIGQHEDSDICPPGWGVSDEAKGENCEAQAQEVEDVQDPSLVPDEHVDENVGDGGHFEGDAMWYDKVVVGGIVYEVVLLEAKVCVVVG
jgi:hypothetical protein